VNSVRLIPVLVLALGALLVFKSIGLITGEGYILGGADRAIAQEQPAGTAETPPVEGEGAPPDPQADAIAAVDGLLDELTIKAPEDGAPADGVPMELDSQGELVPLKVGGALADTEQILLQRLASRRAQLDALDEELSLRAAVVAAAESRLELRFEELKALEAQVAILVAEKKEQDSQEFLALIAMYETMKPTQAATIFNRLGLGILYRVASAMNPRKMAPVLAKMSPDRAEALTIRMASFSPEPTLDPNGAVQAGLPQIVGQ
jgi:flagellar motility protein MotE (MotC chaperone)